MQHFARLLGVCLFFLVAAEDLAFTQELAEVRPETNDPVLVDPELMNAGPDRELAAELAAGAEGQAGARPPLREQTIYIPFNKLREVFEKPGRGVFVPYEQFRRLWELARSKGPQPVEDRPPVGALIREARTEASVEQDVVSVTALLTLETLGPGWHEVPLRLRGAAIRSARIDDQPARVTFDPQTGYKLLLESTSDESQQHILELRYAKSFKKAPAQNTVSFESPIAPVNQWRIRVPESGVRVSVHPLVAATEPAESPDATDQETVLTAFVGAAPVVRIDWTPKAEGATGLAALATVQTTKNVRIEQGVVRTRTQLQYTISRAELSELKLRVPADQRVTSVFDPNVRQWQVAVRDDSQVITVQLFEPARGRQSLTMELEKFLVPGNQTIEIPAVEALEVGRQHGMLVVAASPELRIETEARTGLSQVDAADLPADLRQRQWTLAYRFSSVPFQLSLSVETVKSRLHVDQLVEAYLETEQLSLEVTSLIEIQRSGIFQLQLNVPTAYEIRTIQGRQIGKAPAAQVDGHHRDTESPEVVTVDFARKAIGKVGLMVELRRRLDAAGLLDPNAAAAELELSLPRVTSPAETNRGRLIIYAPESIRANPRDVGGVRSISFDEAVADIGSQRQGRFEAVRPVLAYAYQAGPVDLTLVAQLRRPQTTVRQLLTAHVESGVTRYSARFFYDIRFSGVKRLRIDVPESVSGEIRSTTGAIRESIMQPQPDDVSAGYVAWEFRGETEFLGSQQIALQWDRKTDELEVGGSFEFELPRLVPRGVDRAWGQILLAKAESLDIQPASSASGLRPIDPQHDLMNGASRADVARAFEFHDDWTLAVTAKRYALEDIKRTSIERALVRMVVTRSGQTSVQALYRMRSVAQGLTVQLPDGVEFDADPLRINGQVQTLKHGENELLFIPFTAPADEPFLLELRYTVPSDHRQLELPVFPAQMPIQSEPAVQKVVISVYLPTNVVQLGSFGPWTAENRKLDFGSRRQRDDGRYMRWVSEGVSLSDRQFENFPISGSLYTFSSLRPAPSPEGTLRLVAFPRKVLDGVLFGLCGVFGIALVHRPPKVKLAFLLLVTLALVAAGIFAPTFATELLNSRLLLAVGLLLLFWLVLGVILWRSRWLEGGGGLPALESLWPTRTSSSPFQESSERARSEGAGPEDAGSEDDGEGGAEDE